MKIMLAVPTLNQYPERLPAMLRSVAASTRIPDRVLIVDNGRIWHRQPYAAEFERSFEMDIFTPVRNLGVAGSVNFALRNTPEGWFYNHVNDDTVLDPKCLELMCEAAESNPDGFIIPEHGVGSAFTVFMIHASFRDKVGYLDEVFFPAYFEDDSYGRRMNIAGVRRVVVKGADYHHETSSTLKAYDDAKTKWHHDQFRKNAAEFERMWGGPASAPVFDVPYNGKYGHTPDNLAKWAVHAAPKGEK
jgi:GT2 family glycosyltransferase